MDLPFISIQPEDLKNNKVFSSVQEFEDFFSPFPAAQKIEMIHTPFSQR